MRLTGLAVAVGCAGPVVAIGPFGLDRFAAVAVFLSYGNERLQPALEQA